MTTRRDVLKMLPIAGGAAGTLAACASSSAPSASPGSDADANDIDLFYTDNGTGDVIIFVPGFTFSSEVFDAQVEYFAQTHRVIVVDPRSHGRSPQTNRGNDYPQHGKDLNRLIDKLDLEKFVLIGWSFGALSAWSYAEQFGLKKISKFVCIDMPPISLSSNEANGDWVEIPISQLPGAYHALSSKEGQAAFLGGYAQNVMVQRELSETELDWITSLSLQTPPATAQQLFASGCFSNYFEVAKKIDASLPSLFVIAEHWSGVAEPYVRKHFSNSITKVLGGHMMFWEYPDEFNAMLEEYLKA